MQPLTRSSAQNLGDSPPENIQLDLIEKLKIGLIISLGLVFIGSGVLTSYYQCSYALNTTFSTIGGVVLGVGLGVLGYNLVQSNDEDVALKRIKILGLTALLLSVLFIGGAFVSSYVDIPNYVDVKVLGYTLGGMAAIRAIGTLILYHGKKSGTYQPIKGLNHLLLPCIAPFYYGKPKLDDIREWDYSVMASKPVQDFAVYTPKIYSITSIVLNTIKAPLKWAINSLIIEPLTFLCLPIKACLAEGEERKKCFYGALFALISMIGTLGMLYGCYSSPHEMLITSIVLSSLAVVGCGLGATFVVGNKKGVVFEGGPFKKATLVALLDLALAITTLILVDKYPEVVLTDKYPDLVKIYALSRFIMPSIYYEVVCGLMPSLYQNDGSKSLITRYVMKNYIEPRLISTIDPYIDQLKPQ